MTLSVDEFLRRFLLHLLPDNFVRIRHFGFLANRQVPLSCLFAFTCSAQHGSQCNTHQVPRTPVIFGAALSVLDRWSSSRDSRLPRYNFVLHLWSPPPHDTTLYTKKTLRASSRSVVLRLIAEQISSSSFLRHSLHNILSKSPASNPTLSAAELRHTVSTHLDASSSLYSICIGPASAANPRGFPQVALPKARQSTLLSSSTSREARSR